MRRLAILTLALAVASPARGQGAGPTRTLTLEEAHQIARENNPGFQQTMNTRRNARMGLRAAYASLFPTVGSSMSFGWREGRQEFFAGQQIGAAADVLQSSYSIGISAGYSLQSILGPRRQRAELEAVDAGIDRQEASLQLAVTNQYFAAVEAARNADLQDSLVASQQLQLDLATARERVGSGTALETKTAEVRLVQQQLNALQARNNEMVQKITLFEQMGVAPQLDVRLTTDLPITEPTFQAGTLIAQAQESNPSIDEANARYRSAEVGQTQARSGYFPRVGLTLPGFSGATSMRTDAEGDARTWPFGYSRTALSAGVNLSLSIWDAFGREQTTEAAAVNLSNAQHDLRRTQQQVSNTVTSSLLQLQLAWQAVQLENRNVATAREALALAQERYRVGATAYLDLSSAQDTYRNAENSRLARIYNYHRAFAALEAAVGRPLR